MSSVNEAKDEEAKEMATLQKMAETVQSLEAETRRMKIALEEAVEKAAENSRRRREREAEKRVDAARTKLVKIDVALDESIKYHKAAMERSKGLTITLRGVRRNLSIAKSEAAEGDKRRLESVLNDVNDLWIEVRHRATCYYR